MSASSRASLRVKFSTSQVACRPSEAASVIGPLMTATSIGVLLKNACWIAANPASPVSQTIWNSIDASLSVPTVARQPPLARVVTSASPFSSESVTSFTLAISSQIVPV